MTIHPETLKAAARANVERIDHNEDGTLDDVAISVGSGMFRLEQMDKGHWWLALYMPDGRSHVFHLHSKRRIHARHEEEPAP